MKKSLFMICIFSVIFINAQDCSELFFSEYVEGYSQNKALDEAIAKAKADGAKVDRQDYVFANWDPFKDYGSAQYAEL